MQSASGANASKGTSAADKEKSTTDGFSGFGGFGDSGGSGGGGFGGFGDSSGSGRGRGRGGRGGGRVCVFHLFISLFLLFHVNRDCGTIYILFI